MFPKDSDTHSSNKHEVTDLQPTRANSLHMTAVRLRDKALCLCFGGPGDKGCRGHCSAHAFLYSFPFWWRHHRAQKTHATKAHKN